MGKKIKFHHKENAMRGGSEADMKKHRQEEFEHMSDHIQEFMDGWKGEPIALVRVDGDKIHQALMGVGDLDETLKLVDGLQDASKQMLETIFDSAKDDPMALAALAVEAIKRSEKK